MNTPSTNEKHKFECTWGTFVFIFFLFVSLRHWAVSYLCGRAYILYKYMCPIVWPRQSVRIWLIFVLYSLCLVLFSRVREAHLLYLTMPLNTICPQHKSIISGWKRIAVISAICRHRWHNFVIKYHFTYLCNLFLFVISMSWQVPQFYSSSSKLHSLDIINFNAIVEIITAFEHDHSLTFSFFLNLDFNSPVKLISCFRLSWISMHNCIFICHSHSFTLVSMIYR